MNPDGDMPIGRPEPAVIPPPTPFTPWNVRQVLVPLDGSAASEAALPCAAAIARRTGARITLAHVREEVSGEPPASYPDSLLGDPSLADGVDARAAVLQGAVADVLLAHAGATHVDLIVMTSSGRGGLGRALFGSVTDALVRRSEIPVLVVRPRTGVPAVEEHRPTLPPLRRVLLPLDGSVIAERIVPYALGVTGTDDVHYVLLRVHPALTPEGFIEPGPILGQRIPPGGDPYLSTMSARIAESGVVVSTRAVVHASNADAILDVAAEEKVDLIAMTTRGAGGADRMLFGSVADKVVRNAPCSVLVLRPPAEETSGQP